MERIGLKALSLNETHDFGEGSITFTGWNSWVNLQIVSDPGKNYALIGAILAILGLFREFLLTKPLRLHGQEMQVHRSP